MIFYRPITDSIDLGQVRSECLTCTFRANCCSARLSWAQVPLAGQEKRGEGESGDCLHWQVQGSTSSLTRGWFEVLWNLECPVGLSQREKCAHFNEGNLAQCKPIPGFLVCIMHVCIVYNGHYTVTSCTCSGIS